MRWLWHQLGRLRVRLLAVNLLLVLVPVVGLEFARVYERQLLRSLERDMKNQAFIVRQVIQHDLSQGGELGDPRYWNALKRSARQTRTRIRVITPDGNVSTDSHRKGPPEGPEPEPPSLIPDLPELSRSRGRGWRDTKPLWPKPHRRKEYLNALNEGLTSSHTRVTEKAVYLFVATPIYQDSERVAVVYVTRSTNPVLAELYRVRSALLEVLLGALALSAMITLGLAWTISRPLSRLSRAAKRIAAGERHVEVPVVGSGEIRELGDSFRDMTEQLINRQRYISEFAADVTHELKSPLTSIRGAAELLWDGAMEDPEMRERFLGNIELDVQRLDRLVSRLLELSRIEASTEPMTGVDLEALLERILARLDPGGERTNVDYRAAKQVVGRESDLENALGNLIDNALCFSPAQQRIDITAWNDKGELVIAVRDYGPGVSAANEARIFDRFFTTRGEEDGTGLGLAIVQAVAMAHGGRVTLQRVSPGACFQLRLPPGPRGAQR